MCHHHPYFGINAEWNFFAINQSKSSCDGICDAIKHHKTKRSLQEPLNNQILDFKAVHEHRIDKIKSVSFYGINKSEISKLS